MTDMTIDPNDLDVPGELTVGGVGLELPRVHSTEGSDGLGVSRLLGSTGMVTLDPGFTNTASCTSDITYIDGGAGILRYRGYPIAELAKSSSFLEVAYLLINGELPDAKTLERFERRIGRHRLLHEDFRSFFTSFPSSGHPMAILQAGIAGLATYYEDTLNPHDPYERELATVLLLSKMPTMISYIARRAIGLPLLYPDSKRGYVEDFLNMTFGMPDQTYEIDPAVIRALDMLLILHADHEQNCSTSTVRLVGSSDANMYASVAAGVGALSGPLHGGANEAVLRMLDIIQAEGMTTTEFVRKVKNKEDGVRLMGFGHRVYKNYDPRAALVKEAAHNVLSRLGIPLGGLLVKDGTNDIFAKSIVVEDRNGKVCLELGLVSKALLAVCEVDQEVYFADFNWSVLMKKLPKKDVSYTELSKFPAVRRDLALLLDVSVPFAEVERVARSCEKKLLRKVELFDVYEGEHLPAGKKSYAVAFTLSDESKTMNDKQTEAIMGKIIKQLQQQLGAELR